MLLYVYTVYIIHVIVELTEYYVGTAKQTACDFQKYFKNLCVLVIFFQTCFFRAFEEFISLTYIHRHSLQCSTQYSYR